MKKIFNLSILSLLFLSIMSCSTDDNKILVEPTGAPVLNAPQDGAEIILNPNANDAVAITMVWDHGRYSVETAVDYSIEIAIAGTEFAEPLKIATTNNRFLALTGEQLSGYLLNASPDGLGLPEETEAVMIQARVTATIGDNGDLPETSNTITFNIIFPDEDVVIEPEDPMLFLVGSAQANYGLSEWDNTTAIPMRYIGDGTTMLFEAYVKVGANQSFKFIGEQGTWDNGNYGTIDGAQNGNLQNDGGSGDIKVAETDGDGLYYVWVDIDNLEYKSIKMNWGIIGAATPGGWDGETPMTYDFAENKFSITETLTTENMKLRSKNTGDFISGNEWAFQVGADDPFAYNTNAGDIAVTAGEATIELVIDFDGAVTLTGI
ncbi:SusE domain-containing protein [Flavobacterium litorale]|uniref:SusE domain-containing protein n=1 Tax=Flavobacterium litorale TaxID=2856519 RepID=A0ABX8V748_9FLAO|nr:SusE domain-containing protein [Flavobacterium litorale]QYJ68670.1 SusE domain-containing protein [Flavobacterium litorale]